MQSSIKNRAARFLKNLKLEFTDRKMEQDYWCLKKENMYKDFKVCLEFLILFNVLIVVTSFINRSWIEVYIGTGTGTFVFLVYCFRRFFTRSLLTITLLVVLSYGISRLFMFHFIWKFASKGNLFHLGYTLSSLQGIFLFRLLKVSHKCIGLIVLLALRYLVISLYIEPGPFGWTLFTRHCFIDAFVMYTFYNHESTFRKIYQDFTQKKEELLKFKELLAESLPQGLIVVACGCNSLLFSNKTFQNTFDLSEDSDLLKTYLESLIVDQSTVRETATNNSITTFKSDTKHPLSFTSILEKFDSDNNLNQKTISLAVSTVQNGVRRLFEITLKKVKWDSEDAIAVLFNDITYQESLIGLKLANINKDKVIATVSHELRTPLNGIIGILDITKKKVKNTEVVEYLSLCKDNAHLLLSLVNSILDLQQISAGKLKLNPANIDIRKVVKSITQLFYFQCKEKNISLDYDIHETVPATISTDENRLKQVLINLLGNAVKFTSKGSVRVNININQDNPDNLQVSVSDTGIGIKQDDQNRLFKMYGRIEDGESVNKNGVGLGLTISNALAVLLSGGHDSQGINVESQYGRGSKFSFQIQRTLTEKNLITVGKDENLTISKTCSTEYLSTRSPLIEKTKACHGRKRKEPLTFEYHDSNDFNEFFMPSNVQSKLSTYTNVKKTSSFSLFRHASDNSVPIEVSRQNNLQEMSTHSPYLTPATTPNIPTIGHDVLIVDDNPFNLLVARNLIQDLRCNITTALGGQEAIDIIKKNSSQGTQFKAIFMDCQMPIMDGFETTRTLRGLMETGEIPETPIFGWTANNSEEDVKRCYEVGMIGHLPKPASKMDFSRVLS